jgi:hypothetical protein
MAPGRAGSQGKELMWGDEGVCNDVWRTGTILVESKRSYTTDPEAVRDAVGNMPKKAIPERRGVHSNRGVGPRRWQVRMPSQGAGLTEYPALGQRSRRHRPDLRQVGIRYRVRAAFGDTVFHEV